MSEEYEITVNRRRFSAADGVKPQMSAAELAGLAGVPAANAIVEREIARDEYELVPCDAIVEVAGPMHFLVTRHFVMGG